MGVGKNSYYLKGVRLPTPAQLIRSSLELNQANKDANQPLRHTIIPFKHQRLDNFCPASTIHILQITQSVFECCFLLCFFIDFLDDASWDTSYDHIFRDILSNDSASGND